MERPRRRGARKPQSHHHPYGNNVVRGSRWGIATATGAATGPPPVAAAGVGSGASATGRLQACPPPPPPPPISHFSLFFWERHLGPACCPESIIPPRPTQSGSSVSWEVLAPSDRLHHRFGRRFGPGLSPPPCVRSNAKRLVFCVYAVSDVDGFSSRASHPAGCPESFLPRQPTRAGSPVSWEGSAPLGRLCG